MTTRSLSVEEASEDAEVHDAMDGHDGVPLLGLEPPAVEKAGENRTSQADPTSSTCYAPLLGTSYSQNTENSGKSSQERSPERVCYSNLLRESAQPSGRKSRKTVRVDGQVCYRR